MMYDTTALKYRRIPVELPGKVLNSRRLLDIYGATALNILFSLMSMWPHFSILLDSQRCVDAQLPRPVGALMHTLMSVEPQL